MFEVRSVRLVLREDASHFNRLVGCSKCGREVVGAPVLSSDDLERSPSAVICRACVTASAVAEPWTPAGAVANPDPAPSGSREEGPDARGEALAARLARVEDEVRQGLTALAKAIDAERREVAALAADVAAVRAELDSIPGALERRIAALEQEVREELRARHARQEQAPAARPPAPTRAGPLGDSLEAQLQAAESRLAARAGRPRIDQLIEPAGP